MFKRLGPLIHAHRLTESSITKVHRVRSCAILSACDHMEHQNNLLAGVNAPWVCCAGDWALRKLRNGLALLLRAFVGGVVSPSTRSASVPCVRQAVPAACLPSNYADWLTHWSAEPTHGAMRKITGRSIGSLT